MKPADARIAVVGAGTMGRGIAQTAITRGFHASLTDASSQALAAARAAIETQLAREVAKERMGPEEAAAAAARLATAAELHDALAGADVVIEAVPESLELKRALFARIESAAPPDALLATNTSSLPVGEIAEAVREPGRLLGMHFFNPVPVMALLEIVRAPRTDAAAVDRALAVGRRLGKECIVAKDSPGFATSRLGVVLGLEAIRMLEEEVASAEDIDLAMTLGYRHPMGPLRLTDLVGLDVRLAIAEHLDRSLGGNRFRPPDLLRRMVAEGKLGRKSGEGFYRWEDA